MHDPSAMRSHLFHPPARDNHSTAGWSSLVSLLDGLPTTSSPRSRGSDGHDAIEACPRSCLPASRRSASEKRCASCFSCSESIGASLARCGSNTRSRSHERQRKKEADEDHCRVDSLFSILVTNPVKSLYFLSTSMRILSRSLFP